MSALPSRLVDAAFLAKHGGAATCSCTLCLGALLSFPPPQPSAGFIPSHFTYDCRAIPALEGASDQGLRQGPRAEPCALGEAVGELPCGHFFHHSPPLPPPSELPMCLVPRGARPLLRRRQSLALNLGSPLASCEIRSGETDWPRPENRGPAVPDHAVEEPLQRREVVRSQPVPPAARHLKSAGSDPNVRFKDLLGLPEAAGRRPRAGNFPPML